MLLIFPPKELAKFDKSAVMRKGLMRGLKLGMFHAEGEAKKSFGQPGHIKSRSGHLRRSINTDVKEWGKDIVGVIGSDVVYAAIHEFGGMAGRGRRVKIPARPYLSPALRENRITINRIIQKEIDKAASGRI